MELGLDRGFDLCLFTVELPQSSLTSVLKDYTAWRLHLHLWKKNHLPLGKTVYKETFECTLAWHGCSVYPLYKLAIANEMKCLK